jgi:hypothetical protein
LHLGLTSSWLLLLFFNCYFLNKYQGFLNKLQSPTVQRSLKLISQIQFEISSIQTLSMTHKITSLTMVWAVVFTFHLTYSILQDLNWLNQALIPSTIYPKLLQLLLVVLTAFQIYRIFPSKIISKKPISLNSSTEWKATKSSIQLKNS